MTVFLDHLIPHQELFTFLQAQFPHGGLYLAYLNHDDLMDWHQVQDERWVFQYSQDSDISTGLKYSLSDAYNILKGANLEKFSLEISRCFKCLTLCEATRIQPIADDPYYSLLFDQNKVYLVSNADHFETGEVRILEELTYDWPEYDADIHKYFGISETSPPEQDNKESKA